MIVLLSGFSGDGFTCTKCEDGFWGDGTTSCIPCTKCDTNAATSDPCMAGSTYDSTSCSCNEGALNDCDPMLVRSVCLSL